jgi:Putative transposase
VATERLSLTAQGEIRYALKTPYRDGTTHVVFEPEDFISRLAALVPSPRVNLTRFHGVFAPHHRPRARISARRSERSAGGAGSGRSRSSALGWAQRLKRVFSIDVERCDRCGGGVRIIAATSVSTVVQVLERWRVHHRRRRGWSIERRGCSAGTQEAGPAVGASTENVPRASR